MQDPARLSQMEFEKLDRERRRWKLACLMSFFASLALMSILGAQRPGKDDPPPPDDEEIPRDVVVSKLSLVDFTGDCRGELGCMADLSPYFSLRDRAGKERLRVALARNELPTITLLGASGVELVRLSVSDKGMAEVSMKDAQGITRASLSHGAPGTGAARLSLSDGKGIERCLFEASDQEGVLSFFDRSHHARLRFGLDRDGAGLSLLDGQGKTRARLGIEGDGEPALIL